jgi:hypothetical protein
MMSVAVIEMLQVIQPIPEQTAASKLTGTSSVPLD